MFSLPVFFSGRATGHVVKPLGAVAAARAMPVQPASSPCPEPLPMAPSLARPCSWTSTATWRTMRESRSPCHLRQTGLSRLGLKNLAPPSWQPRCWSPRTANARACSICHSAAARRLPLIRRWPILWQQATPWWLPLAMTTQMPATTRRPGQFHPVDLVHIHHCNRHPQRHHNGLTSCCRAGCAHSAKPTCRQCGDGDGDEFDSGSFTTGGSSVSCTTSSNGSCSVSTGNISKKIP